MTQRSSFNLFSIVSILFFASCSHEYYIPNVQKVPLFREKNEIHATLARGNGDDCHTTEVQAAWSATDHIAVMASTLFIQNSYQNNSARGTYIEGAAGYYYPVHGNRIFSVFTGVGYGYQEHRYSNGSIPFGDAYLSTMKYFIQPQFGLTTNGFDFAFSSRFCILNFFQIDNHIRTDSLEQYDLIQQMYSDLENINQNRTTYLIEPAITVRGGWKYTKVQLQYTFTHMLNNKNLHFLDSNLSIGLYITIAKRFWKTTNFQSIDLL